MHGDYRLDNCMVDDDGAVVAVLDWEICTLGDPLADLGLLQVYWTGPERRRVARGPATPPRRPVSGIDAELVERYAEVSGRDIEHLDFYVAFAYWKLACILEGVYSRYLGGALGERSTAELAPFKSAGRVGGERVGALPGADLVNEPLRAALVDEPTLHEPVLVVALTGWIDAAAAGATAAAVVSTECETAPLVTLRRRHVHRLPGPAAHDGAPRRAQHRPDLGDDRTPVRPVGRRSRHPPADRAGAGHGVAPVRAKR